MIEITIYTEDKNFSLSFPQPVRLIEALHSAGLHPSLPCGGKGSCGKCRVRASGQLSSPTAAETELLGKSALDAGIRLACMAEAHGTVQIHFNTTAAPIQGVTDGYAATFESDPLTGEKECSGVAIDIGTTTIAAYLYSLPSGELLKSVCTKNNQDAFGADVISRIEAAGQGKLTELTQIIRSRLEKIVTADLCAQPDVCVITGNTTMLHLLTGLDPCSMAVSPFTPKSLFGKWYEGTYLPRCMSAYIGADITTAVIASGLTSYRTALLVDVGTNGEMALWHKGILHCCSTAAGPAFEGAGISMGMAATPGAISHARIKDGTLCIETIDDAPACGICGTGLIDIVACLLELGLIDETGYLEDDYTIQGTSVTLTTQDIRQIQLAKSAICSGIQTLLYDAGITYDELEVFCIAGGFGSFIDTQNAAKIGMIPPEVLPISKAVGNAAGMGAGMLLKSKNLLIQSEKLADSAKVIELSTHPVFMEKYIDNMMF